MWFTTALIYHISIVRFSGLFFLLDFSPPSIYTLFTSGFFFFFFLQKLITLSAMIYINLYLFAYLFFHHRYYMAIEVEVVEVLLIVVVVATDVIMCVVDVCIIWQVVLM